MAEAPRCATLNTMTAPKPRPEASPQAVINATGKPPDEWNSILDAAGARDMTHKDIATMLREEHGVSPWWSQHVTVEYERARGMRERHQTTRGYQVSVSKTLPVPISKLYGAFADAQHRGQWLPEAPITVRKDTPGKTTRVTWTDGNGAATNVDISYYASGNDKSRITVMHSKLADAEDVEARRTYWKAALERLAEYLNST